MTKVSLLLYPTVLRRAGNFQRIVVTLFSRIWSMARLLRIKPYAGSRTYVDHHLALQRERATTASIKSGTLGMRPHFS
jgi:hypothetical protein